MTESITVERRYPSEAIGWVTRLDVIIDPNDATKEIVTVGCDTFGAYRWDEATQRMISLITATSITGVPFTEANTKAADAAGVTEVCVAPSNKSRAYMLWAGWLWRSNDGGATWARTTLTMNWMPNHGDRMRQGKVVAIDPRNADIVIVSTHYQGSWFTMNGGADWTKIAGPEDATGSDGAPDGWGNNRMPVIAFDPSSAALTGPVRTSKVYVGHKVSGVWSSTTGANGAFSLMSGSPTGLIALECASNGTLYTTEVNEGPVRKCVGGTWSAIRTGGQSTSLCIHPADPNKVTVMRYGGAMATTVDGGTTWIDRGAVTRVAPDMKILEFANENYMSEGPIHHSPIAPYPIWFGEGIGVWKTPALYDNSPVVWTAKCKGISQHCTMDLVKPPAYTGGGAYEEQPVYRVGQDRAVIVSTMADAVADKSPAYHGVTRDFAINHGWSGCHAHTDPRFVAVLAGDYGGKESSGYSTDSGQTWTKFPSIPVTAAVGGSIAFWDTNVGVWVPNQDGGHPFFTVDRGTTWAPVPIAGLGLPATGKLGWGDFRYQSRRIACADGATANTFHLLNRGVADFPSSAGIYKVVITGSSAVMTKTGPLPPSGFWGYNVHMRPVLGRAGHLWLSGGHVGGDGGSSAQKLWHSPDGGATWTNPFPTLSEAWDFGIGKGPIGASYETIYAMGYVNDEPTVGLYQMDNLGAPRLIGRRVADWMDFAGSMAGDPDVYGRVHVGFSGSGGAWSEQVSKARMS